MGIDIRRLTPADVARLRALRLRALAESPAAFATSLAEEAARPPEAMAARLAEGGDTFTLGAYVDGELVGMAACVREAKAKSRHRAELVGMYVAPEHRDAGIGRRLVGEVVARARKWPGLELITLSVTASQEPARRLYRAAGFVPYGLLPRAFREEGNHYSDTEYMRLELAQAATETTGTGEG